MDFGKLCQMFDAAKTIEADFLHFRTTDSGLYVYAVSKHNVSSMLAEFEKVTSEVDFCSVYLKYACKIFRNLRWVRGDTTARISANGMELSVNGLHLRLRVDFDESFPLDTLLSIEGTLLKTAQHIEVDRKKLLSLCRAAKFIGYNIILQTIPKEDMLVVEAAGDGDKLSYRFSGDVSWGEDVEDEDAEEQKIVLNPEIFEDVLVNNLLGKTVRVYIRNNMPVMVSGNGVRFLIAHKVVD